MKNNKNFDLSAYFVVGPENTKGKDVTSIIKEVVEAGFTCIQIRSKVSSAKDLINMCLETSKIIKNLDKEEDVTLLVDDRLDVVLAARDLGAKVDGIHVGQSDIPVSVCRKYLGQDAIIGLSARTEKLIEYVKNIDVSDIDYFGAGPLHKTSTKPDCGLDSSGNIILRSLGELEELAKISPIPVVVGGGVKKNDLRDLANTGVDGFFVISAITDSSSPKETAKELVETWEKAVSDRL